MGEGVGRGGGGQNGFRVERGGARVYHGIGDALDGTDVGVRAVTETYPWWGGKPQGGASDGWW